MAKIEILSAADEIKNSWVKILSALFFLLRKSKAIAD